MFYQGFAERDEFGRQGKQGAVEVVASGFPVVRVLSVVNL
jgi:hypothetical protein